MPGIPAKIQRPPQRSSRQYTKGTGFTTPPTSTVSTQPLLGTTGHIPAYPYIFGADFDESNQVAVGALGAGASTTITTIVGFPDIPTLKLDPTDQASLKIIPHVWQNPITAGLVIASVQWQPQALQKATGMWVPADNLQSGQVYIAWRAFFTVGVTAVPATGAANLNVGAASFVLIFPQ